MTIFHHKAGLRHIKSLKFGALGLCALLSGFVFAGGAEAMSQVTVQKDQALRVALKGVAGNIIVTNPRIADVTVVDSRTIYIIGRGVGTSGVTVTDQSGRPVWEGSILVSQAPANAVMLFRGTTPVINVCVSTCVEVNGRVDANGAGGATPAPGTTSTAP